MQKEIMLNYLDTTLDMAETAKLDGPDIVDRYPGAVFIEDRKTDTQCYIYEDKIHSIIYVVFRATESGRDVITDISAKHMVCPYGNKNTKILIHKGLDKAYSTVRDKVQALVMASKMKECIIIGHSLGGGLAQLCGVDIQYNITDNLSVYLSGSMKAGNKAFVTSYNKRVPRTYQLCIRRDPVWKLPPKWFGRKLKGGFYNVATKANTLFLGKRSGIFRGLINMIKDRKFSLPGLFNHSTATYKKYLSKLI